MHTHTHVDTAHTHKMYHDTVCHCILHTTHFSHHCDTCVISAIVIQFTSDVFTPDYDPTIGKLISIITGVE